MTTASRASTSVRTDDSLHTAQTRAMSNEDWLMPEPELVETSRTETIDEKPTGCLSNAGTAATATITARKVSAPIRKDRFAIQLSDKKIKLLQQWECVVLNVRKDYIECEMHDLTDNSQPPEYAEIDLDEFHHYDRPLLAEGAVFYWSVGRETRTTGNIRRYSDLRVRRMPPLSKLKKREIAAEAEKLSELLKTQFKH